MLICGNALNGSAERHDLEWHWVKGHAGHPENERADQLARDGMAKDALEPCPFGWTTNQLVMRRACIFWTTDTTGTTEVTELVGLTCGYGSGLT